MNHTAKRNLMIGVLGAALLFGLAAATAAGQDDTVALAPGETAVAAAAPAIPDLPYRLSGPNELDPAGSLGNFPATGGQYRLSTPNEQNPAGDSADGSVHANQPGYRVSPPNEADPAGL